MIRSHLDYIDFVVESGSADRIDNLQKKSNTQYCMVPENRRDINLLYEKYNIESLRLRHKRNLAKIRYSQSTKVQNLKIDTVKMKNDFTTKTRVFVSPLYRGLRLWDSLPTDLQKEKESRAFKKKIAEHFFN